MNVGFLQIVVTFIQLASITASNTTTIATSAPSTSSTNIYPNSSFATPSASTPVSEDNSTSTTLSAPLTSANQPETNTTPSTKISTTPHGFTGHITSSQPPSNSSQTQSVNASESPALSSTARSSSMGSSSQPPSNSSQTQSVNASESPALSSTARSSSIGSSSQPPSNSSQTQSVNASESPALSSTAKSSSMTQSLTPSPSLYYYWANWSVAPEDCSHTCAMDGTIKASRKCISNTVAVAISENSVCEPFSISKTVFDCKKYCPTSGTEVFRSLCCAVAVSILFTMLSIFP